MCMCMCMCMFVSGWVKHIRAEDGVCVCMGVCMCLSGGWGRCGERVVEQYGCASCVYVFHVSK